MFLLFFACTHEPWSTSAQLTGDLSLLEAEGAAFSFEQQLDVYPQLTWERTDTAGGEELTGDTVYVDQGWTLTLDIKGPSPELRVLFSSEDAPLVPAVSDVPASDGDTTVRWDSAISRCVAEPGYWTECHEAFQVRLERRDDQGTTLAWTVDAWAEDIEEGSGEIDTGTLNVVVP